MDRLEFVNRDAVMPARLYEHRVQIRELQRGPVHM